MTSRAFNDEEGIDDLVRSRSLDLSLRSEKQISRHLPAGTRFSDALPQGKGLASEGFIHMAEDWVKKTAAKMLKQRDEELPKEKTLKEKRQLKRDLGPGAWKEVRGLLESRCSELNRKIGQKVLYFGAKSDSELRISYSFNDEVRRLAVFFDEPRFELQWECRETNTHSVLPLMIDQNGKARFSINETASLTAANVAERILGDVVC